VSDQVSTRRLRVVKYRGTTHGTNEYPFLIDKDGFTLLPITSLSLQHEVSGERISSGVPRLDTMLGGEGFYRASTILVSGTAGTGKTSLAAHFVHAACERGERCLFFAFEESPGQLIRNMRSIGLDLGKDVKKGLLHVHSSRATFYGLEMHLALIHKLVQELKPDIIVADPIGALIGAGTRRDANLMIVRLIDFLKVQGITAFLTNLTTGGEALERSDVDISSIVDSWLLLRDVELGGERNRAIYVLKSRGMRHSNQLREFVLTEHGMELLDVYVGPDGVLTGSARVSLEARERASSRALQEEVDRKERERQRKREALEAKILAMRKEFEIEDVETTLLATQEESRKQRMEQDRQSMAISRQADQGNGTSRSRTKLSSK
jgi:circadian clock protein KaiC